MTFTYTGGTTFTSSNPKDGFMDEFTGNAVFVESGLPSFRVVNTSTLVQIASGTCLSNPTGTTMITPLSAVVISDGVTTVDFFEVSSGYRTNVSGGSASPNLTAKNQLVAGDIVNGVAFGCSGTATTLVKITSAQAVSTIGNFGITNDTTTTIILKTPGRWLVGTTFGYIYEIDLNGNIVDTTSLQFLLSTGKAAPFTLSALPIYCMAYDNNLLLIGTDVATFLIDWSTKTVLNTNSSQSNNSGNPNILFCTGASGETIACHGLSNNATTYSLFELDFTIQPLQVRSQLYLDNNTNVYVLALSNNYSTGYSLDSNGRMRVFSISTRASTIRTVSVPIQNTQARLIFLNDTGGTGTCQVLLDTFSNLPATYRVPTGETIMELVKVGNGALAQWDVSRYST